MAPKAKAATDRETGMKICSLKDTGNKVERHPTEWDKHLLLGSNTQTTQKTPKLNKINNSKIR